MGFVSAGAGAEGRVWETPAALDLALADLPSVPAPDRVLLADPAHFDVRYAINPHMRDAAGALRRVDARAARAQWEELRDAFASLGLRIDVVPALAGHPDLVFCANQVLPLGAAVTGGAAALLPARMAHAERAGEVPHVVEALVAQGYRVDEPTRAGPIEGMGDGLWHPGRRLLWAGVGPRSSLAAWREVAERYALPVVVLRPVETDFYHLDTCLQLLDERTCLWVPEALDAPSRALVEALVPRRLAADPEEARSRLAANACCPDGRHVLIEATATRTARALRTAGYAVLPVPTGEFLKAGGSVFCMKLLHGPLP